jgi:hypothetical protein
MPEHICPHCGARFDSRHNRKLTHEPNLSPFGMAGTFSRDLADFNCLVCPICNQESECKDIKIFGVFTRQLFWVPLALVLAAGLFMWWYLRGSS